MNVSLVHIAARVNPDVVVEISATADGRSIVADFDRPALEHLVGSVGFDRKALLAALRFHQGAIRRAIEAYVFARGVPLDGHLTLSWKDLRPFAESPAAAA